MRAAPAAVLPLARGLARPQAPPTPAAEAGGEVTRVLVVDDDDDAWSAVRARLEDGDRRWALERARSVEAALRRLASAQIDVCLTELRLPGRDGLELLGAAAASGWQTPIIVHTAFGSRALDAEALALGAADYLEKGEGGGERLERSLRYALARRDAAERLGRLAQFDPLTGLANRALFHDRLEHALAAARRQQRHAAVLVLDLNGFKPINDRLGHAAGDALLCLMAERLRGRLRESDTVARLGGDEFAMVLEHLGKPEHAALVARKLLDALAPPAVIEGERVSVTASLGVAVFPNDGASADVLLRRADAAMYRAKAEGGHRCCLHDEATDGHLRRGALLASDLRRALEGGEMVLHFQPQVTLGPGPLGLAAVLRWQHPDLGLVEAERFVTLAEDVGLLEALGERVVNNACAQARRWQECGLERLQLAVPILSRRQLAWSDLAERVRLALEAHGLAATSLELEIPEPLLAAELASGGTALQALREVGVRLALSGFGAERACLQLLTAARPDTVKLHRRLLEGIGEDQRVAAMLRGLVAIGRDLGLRIVAEGVARPRQLALLRQIGCHAVQGAISAPPLPAEACLRWLVQAAARR